MYAITETTLPESVKEIFNNPAKLLAKVKDTLVVSNDIQLQVAANFRKEAKAEVKRVTKERKTLTDPIDIARSAAMDLARKPLELLHEVITFIDQKVLIYQDARDKAEAEAKAKADAIAEVERKRQQKNLESQAKRAETSGDEERADSLRDQKEFVQAPVAMPARPKVKIKGMHTMELWHYEVIDFKVLPDEWKLENDKELGKFAKSSKGKVAIPGVQFYKSKTVAGRS